MDREPAPHADDGWRRREATAATDESDTYPAAAIAPFGLRIVRIDHEAVLAAVVVVRLAEVPVDVSAKEVRQITEG
jgi:hypothetical protein